MRVSNCDEASDDVDGVSCEYVPTMVRDLANKFEHLVTDGKMLLKPYQCSGKARNNGTTDETITLCML